MRALSCSLLLAATVALVGLQHSTHPIAQRHGAWPTARSAAPTLSDEQAHGIAIHALGLVGTPYRYGATRQTRALTAAGAHWLCVPQPGGLRAPRTVAQLSSWGQVIDRSERRTGDLVVFGRGRKPFARQIYVGEGQFVHAPSTGGEVRMDIWNQILGEAKRLVSQALNSQTPP